MIVVLMAAFSLRALKTFLQYRTMVRVLVIPLTTKDSVIAFDIHSFISFKMCAKF